MEGTAAQPEFNISIGVANNNSVVQQVDVDVVDVDAYNQNGIVRQQQVDVAPGVGAAAKNLVERLNSNSSDQNNGVLQVGDHTINSETGENLNQPGGSGDDELNEQHPTRKRKYQRHTREQINELESFFKECSHPNWKQMNALSRRLGLEIMQVKFWFQNHRTQMKTELERHENILYRQDNDELRVENQLTRTSLTYQICNGCSDPVIPTLLSIEQHQLRSENIRLKQELNRLCSVANKFQDRPLISSSIMASTPSVVAAPRRYLTIDQNSTMRGFGLGTLPSITTDHQKALYKNFALLAMNEFMTLANIDEPLWVKKGDGLGNMGDILNFEEYGRIAVPSLARKPVGFVSEATRESKFISISGLELVELLMDVNRWIEAFIGLIIKGSTLDVVSNGVDGTKNGALQMMRAEFQAISPMVPVRQTKFLRFCKKHAEGIWAVMDLPLNTNHDGPGPASFRLPSGCVIRDLGNHCCKVTWVENSLYNENSVNQVMQPMVHSGMSFGAKRWIATLQRYCECIAILMAPTYNFPQNPPIINMAVKRSLLKLSQRMVNLFCSGISVGSSSSKWEKLSPSNVSQDVRIAVRKNSNKPGETLGVTLSASTSMCLPISQRRLFEFLVSKVMRKDWDVLSEGVAIEELICLPKAQICGNSVSLLRVSQYGGTSSLILQEMWNDESSSMLVYSPVDVKSMELVMNGGDSTYVVLLPSGFAIFPGGNNDDTTNGIPVGMGSGGGCILTVGLQLLMNTIPSTRVTRNYVQIVNNFLSCTIRRIKNVFHIA